MSKSPRNASIDDDFPPPRRGRAVFRLTLLSLLGICGTAGFGYLWWQLRQEQGDSASELTAKRTLAARCEKELAGLKTRDDTLTRQVASCQAEKQGTESKQHEAEAIMTSMEQNLHATKDELDQLRAQHAEAEKRLDTFKDLTARFQKMIDDGKIEVKVRGGQMLVALPAEVLFPSGSADLSDPGKLAVLQVGAILKQFPDRKFMVVGHTDNLPIKGAAFKDNWQLSTARAVTVAELLISAGLSAKNMLAGGHGEFDPVAPNKSKDGQAKNRRIEIILLPNLDELPPLPKELREEKPAK